MGVIRAVWQIVWTASLDFVRHQASRMGASLAFYSVLSLAPLLVLTLVVGGMFVNEQEIRDQLIAQMQQTVGREGSEALADMLTKRKNGGSLAATLLGIATLLFGASGVFGELQHAMNTIWGVEAQANAGWWRLIRDRFLAFVLVVGSGMLLLATLVLSTFVAGAGEYLTERWPRLEPLGNVPTMLATFGVITFLFGMMFKILPDVRIPWRDVWFGAVLTSLLFSAGKYLIGLYLGRSSYSSAYGAAGSLVVLVVWIYYSSQIIFFGAELTQAYSRWRGTRIAPQHGAIAKTEDAKRRAAGTLSQTPESPAPPQPTEE